MKNTFNKMTETIIGGAIAVHRALGPGLLESAYEACLSYELVDRGLSVERQKALRFLSALSKISAFSAVNNFMSF